jgi:hypothetical protein
MANTRSISILLNDDDLGTAQELARTGEIDLQILPKPQIVEPFTLIVVGGALVLTFKFMVDLIERLRGGLVIDLRLDARYLVRRDREVPAGWVVVVATDGRSVKIETHDAPKDTAERLLSQIIDGSMKTSQEIAKAAKEMLGPEKVQDPAASV